jgi:hypothetical protein
MKKLCIILVVITTLNSCKDAPEPQNGSKNFTLTKLSLDGLDQRGSYPGVGPNPVIELSFSEKINQESAKSQIILLQSNGNNTPLTFSFFDDNSRITIIPTSPLASLTSYSLVVQSALQSELKKQFGSVVTVTISTALDPADKFTRISDEALMDSVQRRTFKYFWNFAHPASGMARERNSSGDIVTTGGTGFGLMGIIVGIAKGFVSRDQGLQRLTKIVTFLETADRFHGAWSHWVNGQTGKVVPFSSNDNGGDLVETAFLIEGLLTVRQYLNPAIPAEQLLIDKINELWKGVEWDWYTQGGKSVLYWHWSPDKNWIMNHQIKGYNEALIVYVLAASSPTHSIEPKVYNEGWASNGGIKNNKQFYDVTLPLGFDLGGPLFFAHYSFLGLDPRNLADQYGNYWTQNVNHSLINFRYCVANPKKYAGYSEDSWGLTASDNQSGYSAHSPTNDLGVISPTAALSSMPYTPEESKRAMRFFYYKLGDKLWGPHGFYDAFNLNQVWFANSYLAIDQGPILVMIENHRTGKLWNLFMTAPEVKAGLTKLAFTY